ncbi:hypothetical protein WICPIJ_009858 [Wickerhamomyces pijperi]|uniref:Uncharacterized protein n=1 Tax=Wickerhamomyces pijperi TaxID=599730 RepID=A0A9P8PKV2_WICPI|nr:hypothetical protein WICPIJ_009858 [Wickerhamomyces pijperi]
MATLDQTHLDVLPKSVEESSILLANATINVVSSNQFLHILDFLNASRSGTAQSTAGINFQTFLSSLFISIIYCCFQVSIFSLLRSKIKHIYQPNCYYVSDKKKVPPLKEGLFSWLPATIMCPLTDYKAIGLDAYFIIRFLSFLIVLFFGLALMNIPVLITVNYKSGYSSYSPSDIIDYTNGTLPIVSGLDSISMSNIAPKFSKRLSVHLTMLMISVIWFHTLVISELREYIRIKNQFLTELNSKKTTDRIRDHKNTLLIDNVPLAMIDKKLITEMFDNICGSKIKNIWFVYDYGELKGLYARHLMLLDQIEQIETLIIYKKFFGDSTEQNTKDWTTYKNHHLKYNVKLALTYRMRFWLGFVPYPVWPKLQDLLVETTEQFTHNRHLMMEKRERLAARDRSPLTDHRYNKVFIQFDRSLPAHLLNQVQISNKFNQLDKTMLYTDPKDMNWSNLAVQSNLLVFVRVIIGNFLACVITLGWVIPVAFIGLVTQMPYLTALYPFLSWMKLLPEYITDVISNLLSVILLMCLSELVPYIFRWLSTIKCKRSGAEIELDVQRWMFFFLFLHIFLIVTISSGFTVILQGLLNNPVSIPNILATNLPKCSNFFFTYILVRGLSYFGNTLVQNYQLFKYFFIDPLRWSTPRRKFEGLASPPVYKWGSIYATFSVLGSIGLIYSILSPLILVFCVISFAMILISFKYSLKYQYSQVNHSENYGQFYPRALYHLYYGIYFLEICLIGLFALSRNEFDEANCLYHALLTLILLILTAVGQSQTQKLFQNLLTKNLSLTLHKSIEAGEKLRTNEKQGEERHELEDQEREQEQENELIMPDLERKGLHNDTFFQECFQNNNATVWLPKDEFGFSDSEIIYLKELGIDCSNSNSTLTSDGVIEIQNSPPDFLEDYGN